MPPQSTKALIRVTRDGWSYLPRDARATRTNIDFLKKLIWKELREHGATLSTDWKKFKIFAAEVSPPNNAILVLENGETEFGYETVRWKQLEEKDL